MRSNILRVVALILFIGTIPCSKERGAGHLCHKISTRRCRFYIRYPNCSVHQDIKMTQRYSHHCPDSLREGVEILEIDYSRQKRVFECPRNNCIKLCNNYYLEEVNNLMML